MEGTLRPEIKKALAIIQKVDAVTLVEMRAVLRAVITAATGRSDWMASVSAGKSATGGLSLTMYNSDPAHA